MEPPQTVNSETTTAQLACIGALIYAAVVLVRSSFPTKDPHFQVSFRDSSIEALGSSACWASWFRVWGLVGIRWSDRNWCCFQF